VIRQECATCSSERQLEVQALDPLERADHFEQVARLRVRPGTEHAHEALGRPPREAAELLEADRGVDVVAKDGLPGIEIAGQEPQCLAACSLERPIVPQEDRLFAGSTVRSRRSSPVIRMPAMSIAHGKILVHLKDRRRLVVDAHDVYYLEARGDETDIGGTGGLRLKSP
jgi:hypothetical protein